MAENDDWRRERAEALGFGGSSRINGAVRVEEAALPRDGVLPMMRQAPAASAATFPPPPQRRPVQSDDDMLAHAEAPPQRSSSATRPDPPRSRGRLTQRQISPLVVAAAIVALGASGSLGWVLHDDVSSAANRRAVPVTHVTLLSPPTVSAEVVVSAPAVSLPADGVPATLPDQPKEAASRAPNIDVGSRLMAPQRSAVSSRRVVATNVRVAGAARGSRWSRPAHSLGLSRYNFAPSFNCRRATAKVNQMICRDRELASLDNQMSAAYYGAIEGGNSPYVRAIDAGQTDFLNERSRCRSSACTAQVYRDRIDQLAEFNSTGRD